MASEVFKKELPGRFLEIRIRQKIHKAQLPAKTCQPLILHLSLITLQELIICL